MIRLDEIRSVMIFAHQEALFCQICRKDHQDPIAVRTDLLNAFVTPEAAAAIRAQIQKTLH